MSSVSSARPHRPEPDVTPAMVDLLCATRGWALCFAVLNWITAVILVGGALTMVAISIFADDGSSFVRALAWPYLAAGLLTAVPALLLTRYSRALRRLRLQRREQPMIDALHHERRLWKFAAIATLAFVGIAVVGLVAAIAIPFILK